MLYTHQSKGSSLTMPSKESEIITSKKSQVLIEEKSSITISDNVFDKIKYLCRRFRAVEWSGLIWMDIEGTVEDPANLKINVIDFTLFDIGSGAYTEFEVDPEIIMAVYDKHPEYITKKYGCIHSHNNMSVFFSGTDTSTLLEQAFIHNFFVSLIINNDFDKIAKISYKGKRSITEKYFNRLGNVFLPFNKTYEEDVVYVIDCNVDYQTTIFTDSELLEQVETLNKKEEEKKKRLAEQASKYPVQKYKKMDRDFDWPENQLPLFEEKKYESSKKVLTEKCEKFVKQLMNIDHGGDETIGLTLAEAKELRDTFYADANRLEYLEELSEFCDDLFDLTFQKEIEANWYEEDKFKKLRVALASEFQKFLTITIPIERDILEIIDSKLKELENERKEGFVL